MIPNINSQLPQSQQSEIFENLNQNPKENLENNSNNTTYYFEVLVPLKLPNPILTYSFNLEIQIGTIVTVMVRNKEIKGIIWKVLDNSENKITDYFTQNKIQIQVIRSLIYNRESNNQVILSKKNIEFLKLIYLHSFNQLGVILESFLLPYTQLSNRAWGKIEKENQEKPSKEANNQVNTISKEDQKPLNEAYMKPNIKEELSKQNIPEFISFEVNQLVEYIKVRIRAIIRSNINAILINKNDISGKMFDYILEHEINLLQIIPERKYLKLLNKYLSWDQITKEVNTEIQTLFNNNYELQEQINNNNSFNIQFNKFNFNIKNYNYSYSDKSSETQTLIKNLITNDTTNIKTETSYNSKNVFNFNINLNVYTGTRGIIFLPFNKVDFIYLFDEGNSFYIQEQNSIYYDTRELIYYFARIYNSKLYLISNHQSTRAFQYQRNIDTKEIKKQIKGKDNYDNKNVETLYNLQTEQINTKNLRKITENNEIKKTLENQNNQPHENPIFEYFQHSQYNLKQEAQKSLKISLVNRNYFNSSVTDIFSFEVDQIIKKELGLED